MVAGLIVVQAVSLVTKKLSKDEVDEMFSCYDETVTVHKKKALSEK